MTAELEPFLSQEPFVPFRIILTSGTAYDVISPLQLVVERGWISFYFERSDRQAKLRLNQIAAVETLAE